MRRPWPWEMTAWLAALLSFGAFVFLDLALWHPGVAAVDEAAAFRYAAADAWHPAVFTGSWMRALQSLALANRHWISVSLLPAFSLLCFLYEILLLSWLALRLFSSRAALGAALFTLLSAYGMARARSLLSYTLLPLEWLLALHLLLGAGRGWRAAAAGALLGLAALDYEAWPAAWLGLALASPALSRRLGFSLAALGAGFALGLGCALALNEAPLASYLATRKAVSLAGHAPWGGNLASLAAGGPTLPALGAGWHPALPPWSWPLLALGCAEAWKRERWLLAAAGCGLLPLLLPSAISEPNRGIAAWPALALAAGLGLERASSSRFALALPLWVLLGAGVEARAFWRSQQELAPAHYGPSLALEQACRWARREGGVRLLSNLSYQAESQAAWLAGRGQGGRVLALLPWEALPALGDKAGDWRVFESPDGKSKAFLLEPAPAWRARLLAADEQLGAAWSSLNRYDAAGSRARLLAMLDKPRLDPWVRTALWQRLMTVAAISGQADGALVERVLREPLLHAGPLHHPSLYLARHEPELAARLRARALELDPRLRDE